MNKLIVSTNDSSYEYDIHSLVKAFFPEADVKVNKVLKDDNDSDGCEKETLNAEASESYFPDLTIRFFDDSILLSSVSKERVIGNKISIAGLDRTGVKSALKKLIYKTLEEETGISLPWGTLTGIRPTKIPMKLLEEGATLDEIREYMKEVYLISDEKLELSIDIAKREKALLDKINYENGYSLYIGIPFCPTTCMYCSFTSYPIFGYKNIVSDYLKAVSLELDYVASSFKDKKLDTVYIGGGTPTTLEAEELEILLNKVTTSFDMSQVLEFTVEAGRADSITYEKLKVLKKYNVTRISVNPQTMNQCTLDMIGRRHTVDEVIKAYEMARDLGFDNINMDIILGLPSEDVNEVKYTIDRIKELSPESLTVHSLAIKRASRMAEWIKENGLSTLKNTDETMEIASIGAKDMGMNPYYLYRQKNMSGNFENVGYSKEGKEGIYNILIMEEVQTIIACGAGTVTKRVYGDGRIERCDNVKDVKLYIEKIEEMINRKRELFKD
ncbi:MAG: coproporphyrinogen dehydrogenase HemZ [Lachnospiraceae bacterium]|nr:coproporphyrinogen dehydrogenase HemZ [Lachnospiraceae bacterium]